MDNASVRTQQIEKLRRLREERDERAVDSALTALTNAAAASAEGSPRSTTATCWRWRSPRPARRPRSGRSPTRWRRCTGGTPGQIRTISGVYREGGGASPRGGPGPARPVAEFEEAEGRRPRILVAKMGQDGHDRGQKVIATAFADLGFDVDVGPLFQTPGEVARQAVEADVHIVGRLVAGRRAPHPGARAARRAGPAEGPDIMVVVGGVIPPADVPTLHEMGAAAVFRPGHGDRRGRGRPGARSSSAALHGPTETDGPRSRRPALVKGVLDGSRAYARPRDHARRVAPGPTTGLLAQELLQELLPQGGRGAPRGRSAGCPASGSRPSSTRSGTMLTGARAPGGGPGGGPVVHPDRRLDPGRQDADGAPGRRRERVRPALAQRRHARRGRARDAGDDRADGGRGLRRRAGGDRRGRPVGGRGRGHGRLVPAAHDGAYRGPAAGHQEGHPRARRRRRGEQGGRPARARRPRRRPRAGGGAADGHAVRTRPGARRCSRAAPQTGAGLDEVWDRGDPAPHDPRDERGARGQARRPAGPVDVDDGPRPAHGPAARRPRGPLDDPAAGGGGPRGRAHREPGGRRGAGRDDGPRVPADRDPTSPAG